eukprot:TRINITY_DN32976_c0_g3_i2.p2 TRINITY_DN32976_c0_g3~~TRINITY_DN32976_c0_g3_i2.p2  ORF type:complete len:102 (-),score=14.32 TRINITY_DN32976_c0_g3_i2:500-805(-)
MTQSQETVVAKTEEGCTVGCFKVKQNSCSALVPTPSSPITVTSKSRHCDEKATGLSNNWRCPDPGCKTINSSGKESCANCHLPKHTTHEFKRGESKILKQL